MAIDGVSVPMRYVPKSLSNKDKKAQKRELRRSRKAYKKGKYHTRKKMSSFKSKESPHIQKAKKMYKLSKLQLNSKLAKATKCKLSGLKKIFRKGQGAYFSSGSRPNQTAHSWAYARLGSAITGGNASAVDFSILEKSCAKNSKALRLARKTKKKRVRKAKSIMIGGKRKTKRRGNTKLIEKIIKFERGPRDKKYTATVRSKDGSIRKIHFGAKGYQQYRDSTPLGLYKSDNHGDFKRMQRYYSRHSGTKSRLEGIKKEIKKSGGLYNAKILSHIYLW